MYKIVQTKWNEKKKAMVSVHCAAHTKTLVLTNEKNGRILDMCSCGDGVEAPKNNVNN